METGLLYLHSALRYLILILLVWSMYSAVAGLIKRKKYSDGVQKIYLITRILLDIQMVIGFILYFAMGYFYLLGKLGSLPPEATFFTIIHITGMITGISIINIGYFLAGKAEGNYKKYKRITISYGIGFIIIFLMIPWPFFHTWATWF